MIVFDLKCGAGHVFEAWFGSATDYEDQRARTLVLCPLCGDAEVIKAVMAPNLAPRAGDAPSPAAIKAVLTGMARAQATVEATCDYVGRDFVPQARAMHHGEVEQRGIYGEATAIEARALKEEGVEIAALPFRPKAAADA